MEEIVSQRFVPTPAHPCADQRPARLSLIPAWVMYSLSSVTYSLSSGSVQHGGPTQSRDRRTPPDPHQRNSCLGVSIVALLHDDASTTLLGLLGLLLVPPVMSALDSLHTILDAFGALFTECMGAMGCQSGVLARHTILIAGTTVVGRAAAAIPLHPVSTRGHKKTTVHI